MKANELRLGNWIKTALSKDRGKPYQVVALRDNEVSTDKAEFQFNPIWTDLHYIKPIRLTEEWLLKFGFEIDENENYRIQLDEFTTYLQLTETDMFYPIIGQSGELSHEKEQYVSLNGIKDVHQLQNLYFALTGQELEIKELTFEKNES